MRPRQSSGRPCTRWGEEWTGVYRKGLRIHCVGIGGIGMSGIAELLLNLGYRVSGSDLRLSDTTDRLTRLGAEIRAGHAAGNYLEEDGEDPYAGVGGKHNSLGSNAKLGSGDFLVAEADESDGSFLKLSPTVAVVTNIDAEHLDYYSVIGQIKETFLHFLNKVPFYGFDVLCVDHPNVQELIPALQKTYVTYGFSPQAE